MAEIRTVTTLTYKQQEIERTIAAYERRLAQSKADLAHVRAAIRIIEGTDEAEDARPYIDIRQVYRYGEIAKLCKPLLESEGPLDTREIAERVMNRMGLDFGDKVMARAIQLKIVTALGKQFIRGQVIKAGKHGKAIVWAVKPRP